MKFAGIPYPLDGNNYLNFAIKGPDGNPVYGHSELNFGLNIFTDWVPERYFAHVSSLKKESDLTDGIYISSPLADSNLSISLNALNLPEFIWFWNGNFDQEQFQLEFSRDPAMSEIEYIIRSEDISIDPTSNDGKANTELEYHWREIGKIFGTKGNESKVYWRVRSILNGEQKYSDIVSFYFLAVDAEAHPRAVDGFEKVQLTSTIYSSHPNYSHKWEISMEAAMLTTEEANPTFVPAVMCLPSNAQVNAIVKLTATAMPNSDYNDSFSAVDEPWIEVNCSQEASDWLITGVLRDPTIARSIPKDAQGNSWYDPDYDDSNWFNWGLPDLGSLAQSAGRIYRHSFNSDPDSENQSLTFSSDDGIWIYLNGQLIGH